MTFSSSLREREREKEKKERFFPDEWKSKFCYIKTKQKKVDFLLSLFHDRENPFAPQRIDQA